MNWAHIHLLLNHVPVLGTIFGLALLGYAVLKRSEALKRAALGVFVAVALLALPVYFTGEPAEEAVQSAAGVSKSSYRRARSLRADLADGC
jgi:beta-lactamase regulating signal transducer with metallopeptidase domain